MSEDLRKDEGGLPNCPLGSKGLSSMGLYQKHLEDNQLRCSMSRKGGMSRQCRRGKLLWHIEKRTCLS